MARGGVVIFNQHHQESLYEKGKLNLDLKEVREDQGMIQHQVQRPHCGRCSGIFENSKAASVAGIE